MTYSRHRWLGMSIHDLHHQIFDSLFKGRTLSLIELYAAQFVRESLKGMIYLPAIKRLKEAQSRGDYVLILSSSPDFLVREIAHALGVNHWKATKYEANNEGERKLMAISHVMEGLDKADVLINLSRDLELPHSAITVYSDSYLDLPILKMAGRAIAVKPDSRLKTICLQNGWEIL